MKLAARVAVVTGAGSGVGREISRHLAAGGARVAAVDLAPATADETIAALPGEGHFAGAVDVADAGVVHYSASKAAVLGITRSTAREFGRFGIRVNAICPGGIDTPMTQGVPDAVLAPIVQSTPLVRQGQPEDIAKTAVFLASDDSSFITGQWISPSGGLVMR